MYWFCHTSTWICQGCTRIHHPEHPSHLPPRTIPLGHSSAPAPSILYPALNLDWRFVSYMILNFKRGDISIHMADSICCAAETKKTLLWNCTPIKINFKKPINIKLKKYSFLRGSNRWSLNFIVLRSECSFSLFPEIFISLISTSLYCWNNSHYYVSFSVWFIGRFPLCHFLLSHFIFSQAGCTIFKNPIYFKG